MAGPNEIPYWKISVIEKDGTVRAEFVNAVQLATRIRLGQITSGNATEANMYYKTGNNTYRPAKKNR